MNYYILDLEWNGAFSKYHGRFVNEIIEIGAIRLNERLDQSDVFSCFVYPKLSDRITGRVNQLTNLSIDDLKDGLHFEQAYSELQKWLGEEEYVILTWSKADLHVLLDNCKCFLKEKRIPLLSAYIDLQKYVQYRLGVPGNSQIGLTQAAELLQIDLKDREMHRALEDSRVCGDILRSVFDKESFFSFIEDAENPEFYRRLQFKNYYITDLNSQYIQKNELRFVCEHCGKFARRDSEWKVRNKSVRAVFLCKKCLHRFYGQLRFKKTYDGIIVKRSTFAYVSKADNKEMDNLIANPH